jgi:Zn-dependent protease
VTEARALGARRGDRPSGGRGRGIPLGSLAGIPFRIDASWIVIFLLVAWSAATWFPQAIGVPIAPVPALALGALASLALFGSIVLHELSHSLVARMLGYEVHSITLFIFGGVSEISGEPRSARDEAAIAIVGPLTSLAIAGLALGAANLTENPAAHAFLRYLLTANVALAVFNMFPGFPLDGGRVLRAAFRAAGDTFLGATRKAAFSGRALGLVLMAFGISSFIFGGGLGGAWLALIGWFLRSSADLSLRQATFRARADDLHVSDAAERVLPLAPEDTARTALLGHGLLAGPFERYPVVRAGQLLGMVEARDLRALPRERWDEVKVGELVRPELAIDSGASLLDAIDRLASSRRREIPVADVHGVYEGVLRVDSVARLAQEREVDDEPDHPGDG